MVSATNINNHSILTGQTQGMTGTPETGEFDFLSYLLGLQVNSLQDSSTEDTSLLAPKTGQNVGAEDELLSPEVKEKDLSQWNPLFPGIATEVAPGRTSAVDKSEVGSADLMSSRSSGLGMTPAMFHRSSSVETAGNSTAALGSRDGSKASEGTAASPRHATQKYAAFQSTVESQAGVTSQAEGNRGSDLLSRLSLKSELINEKHAKKREHVSSMENPFTLGATTGGASQIQEAASIVTESSAASTVPELFENVESMVHSGGGKMTVHLSPPELGQVQIQVTARGRNVEIEMTSDNDLTKSVLESKLGDLKNSMQAQDLVLNKMEVHVSRESSAFGDGQFAGFEQGQSQQSQGSMNQRQSQSQGRSFAPESNPSSLSRMTAPLSKQAASNSGRVDIRI